MGISAIVALRPTGVDAVLIVLYRCRSRNASLFRSMTCGILRWARGIWMGSAHTIGNRLHPRMRKEFSVSNNADDIMRTFGETGSRED